MDYEVRFKQLLADMIDLLEKHTREWRKTELNKHDIDEATNFNENELEIQNGNIEYPLNRKKSASKNSGLFIQ